MNNKQKRELRWIIKSIPIIEYNKSISQLHKEYGYEFVYGTFRSYFNTFKRKEDAQSGGKKK